MEGRVVGHPGRGNSARGGTGTGSHHWLWPAQLVRIQFCRIFLRACKMQGMARLLGEACL